MLSFFPQTAHAQWQFDHYDQSISITGGTATPPTFPATTSSSTFGLTWGTTSGSVTVSATLTPVFIWEGMGAATPLYVKLQGSTYVNYSPPGGAASDGLDDPQQVSPYTDSSLSSAGSHLVQVPGSSGVPDGTQVPLAPVTLSASVPNGGYINISLIATGDTRAVTLSRNGARQVPEMKLPNGETCGEWVDPDGTAHGDTTFSYWSFIHAGLDSGEVPNLNWQGFTANYSGGWVDWASIFQGTFTPGIYYWGDPNDPLYVSGQDPNTALSRTQSAPAATWSWTPDNANDWELGAVWSAPYGPGNDWVPAGRGDLGLYTPNKPRTDPIIYKTTAAIPSEPFYNSSAPGLDGAQATATYDLTFHDPVDNWQKVGGPNTPATEEQPELYGWSANVQLDPFQPLPLSMPVSNSAFEIDIAGLEAISMIATAGSAVVGAWPTAVELSSPQQAAGVAGLLALFGSSTTDVTPSDPQPDSAPTDFGAFQNSVTEENRIESHTAGNLGDNNEVMRPDILRFAPSSFPNGIANSINSGNEQQWYNGFFGFVHVQAQEGRHRFNQSYVGYGWDTAGFTGMVSGNVHYAATPFAIYQWSFVSQPPSGTGH